MESPLIRFRQLASKLITIELFSRGKCLLSTSSSISRKLSTSLSRLMNIFCRIVDIASVDEIASRWNKRVFNKRDAKESRLRAEPNVRRAIQRMQYYKVNLFKGTSSNGTNEERNIFDALLPNANYGIPLFNDDQ